MREPGYQRIRGGLPVGETIPDKLPRASSVAFSGTVQPTYVLTGSYQYSDDLTAEGTSTYNWYLSDDALGTNKAQISGETGLTYTVAALDDGKFISFEVTPVDAAAVAGAAVESAREEVTAPAWTAYFDDTYWWEDGEVAWATDRWTVSGSGSGITVNLYPRGGWVSGFRHTQCRITFTEIGNTFSTDLKLKTSSGTTIGWMWNSGSAVNLTYSADMARLEIALLFSEGSSGGIEITNIEFYG